MMKYTNSLDWIYVLEERKTSDGDNYCLRSHHLAPMRMCYGKTVEEVEEKALKEGLERI